MLFLRLIKESFISAFGSLRSNKLRTLLSLFGITIGIFAITSVFTAIDALEGGIKQSIDKLGNNMVYVQKWPWLFGGNYPWWKYINRPLPQLDESELIEERSQLAEVAVFGIDTRVTASYKNNYIEEITIAAYTNGYPKIRSFEMAKGRFFSDIEANFGKNCCVIGYETAENLFEGIEPVGKTIKVSGNKIKVVGVFSKEGEDDFGISHDQQIVTPVNYIRTLVDIKKENLHPYIMVKAKDKVKTDDLISELRGVIRSIRRLKPSEDDDFALNKSTMVADGIRPIFLVIDIAGIIIGGFSILVGGFGIANIMFVSVKEQTRQIGIQKALGAKKYFILLHFLFEAIALSLIGGVAGVFLIWLLIAIFNLTGIITLGTMVFFADPSEGMEFVLTLKNISIGLSISIIVGVISGFLPARKAANLDPVVAINAI